jgi:hypothetical protein
MIELKLFGVCDHQVEDIYPVQGISPNYYIDLPYKANPNVSLTVVRDFAETDGLTNFIPNIDGITNFTYSNDSKQIVFGMPDIKFKSPDNREGLIPEKQYVVNYPSVLESCPKCQGTNIVHDITYDPIGRLYTFEGKNKVSQQIIKVLLTVIGSNLFDDAYGSTLSTLLGKKIDAYLAAKLEQSVLDGLGHLQALQESMGVPDTERIIRVASIQAVKDSNDPRRIMITVTVTVATFQEVSTTIGVHI